MAGFLPMWSPINSNIGDGSNLWDTAIKSQAKASDMLSAAVDTIRTNQQNSANAALLQAYQKALANGATPDEARASAAAAANPFVTADTLSNMFQNSRYDMYSNIQKAQEDRAAKDWQGQNEAANINALAAQAFRLRNTKAFNDAMAQGNTLDPVAKKFLKYEDLVKQNLADDNDKLNLEKGKLDMANTRQAMAERARKAQLEEQQLAGYDLIAKTNAVMAEKGYDPKASTYGALYRDTLNQVAASKGIKDPTYFVARFAPDYLPYIKEGNIYDKGVNLKPTAEASNNATLQELDNRIQYTDDGAKDTSLAFGMEKGGADLSASRAQAIKLAIKGSGLTLTKEQEATLANLANNPKATAKDFNDFKNTLINNYNKTAGESSVAKAMSQLYMSDPSLASQVPLSFDGKDLALANISFTDTGSGIESTAKTKAAQIAVDSFMTNINAANDAYQTRKQNASLLKSGATAGYSLAFETDPTKLTKYNISAGKTLLNQSSLVLNNQKDRILKNYDNGLLKLGKAKSEFDALGSSLDSTLKDYGKTEEALAKQLGYGEDIPKFRKKFNAAINKAKEYGASDASARLAVQHLINVGKFSSNTLTPDWSDSELIAAVNVANKIEEQSPGILTQLASINAQLGRNALGIQTLDAANIGDSDRARKLQQQMQMTYSGENNPVNTGN